MEGFTVISPATFEASHYDAVVRLLAQLTTRTITFTADMYRSLISSNNSHLCLLLDTRDGQVVGMLTMGVYLSPTGSKAWIEDVVVDHTYRGRKLGRRLVEYAIGYARQQGVHTLMLTSNPKRVAANALYRSVGFEHKETNVYKMLL